MYFPDSIFSKLRVRQGLKQNSLQSVSFSFLNVNPERLCISRKKKANNASQVKEKVDVRIFKTCRWCYYSLKKC